MWNTLTILVARKQMVQDIRRKLKPGLSWLKHHSTGRKLFSPANITVYINI
jgi:hypothetical protein